MVWRTIAEIVMKQPQWRLEACGLHTAVAGKRSDELACMLANAWVTGLDLEKNCMAGCDCGSTCVAECICFYLQSNKTMQSNINFKAVGPEFS